jgi:hypothetical protein
MKLGLTDIQYNSLLTVLQEQGETPSAEPEKGTSDKQSGGQGYPAVGKWESGVTRGPGNQIGITKWADVVGSKLNRGKANQLKETEYTKKSLLRLMSEQTPTKTDSTKTSSETKPEVEYDPNKGGQPATVNWVDSFRGADQPTPPIPAKEKYPNQCQYYAYGSCPYELENQAGEPYFWYYHSVGPYKFWPYVDDLHAVSKSLVEPNVDYKLGNYNTNDFVGTKLEIQGYYENEFDWWLQGNLNTTLEEWKRYHGRISKNGVQVPKGFNPDDYDEYLAKIAPYQKQLDYINGGSFYELTPKILQSIMVALGYTSISQLKEKKAELEAQIESIKKKYYSEEFSYGISFEELEHYYEKVNMINQEYGAKINELKSQQSAAPLTVTTNVISGRYDDAPKDWDSPEIQAIKKEWKERLDNIDMIFGKDDWIKDVGMFGQSFDRFWDKWGTVLAIVGNIAIIAASGGIAGIVEGASGAIGFTLESGILRAAAPYAADVVFNSLIATYEHSRGKNEAAIISFLCAMIPFMSWEKNIGKVSLETAESLSKKVILSKFETKEQMEVFVKNLTSEERRAFRDVMTLPKESIIKNYDLSIKELYKEMTKTGVKVAKSEIYTWVPALLKQIGIEGGVPLSASLVNGYFKLITDKYGHIYTDNELARVKQYLNGLKGIDNKVLLVKMAESEQKIEDLKITKENKPDLIKVLTPIFEKEADSKPQIPDSLISKLPQKFKNNLKLVVDYGKNAPK